MRTTLELDDALLRAARERAASKGTTLAAFVEAALAAALAPAPAPADSFRLRWKTHRGRLRAGIDVADRGALFDLAD